MHDGNRNSALTFESRPLREMCRLAWPIAISMLSYTAMTLVDTAFVAGVGAAALAGVGIGGVIFMALICFPLGLLRATKVLVAQAVGAGRAHTADEYLSAALMCAASLAVMTMVIGLLGVPLATALAPSPQAQLATAVYLEIRILSVPLVLGFAALREFAYGMGNSRTPMYAAVAGNLVNIALDYVFVCILGAGVAGAAWATVIGVGVEALVILSVLGGRKLTRRGAGRRLGELWRVGFPTGAQFLLEVGSFTLLSVVIAHVGELDLAAHQVVLHLSHVSFLPAYAIAEAASVMVGQAVGARREEWVGRLAIMAMKLAFAYTAMCTVAFAIGAPWIAAAFTDDGALRGAIMPLIYVACGFLVADSANLVARSILRGVGDVRVPAVVATVTAWAFTPPIAWVAGVTLGLGAVGGWIGLSVEIFVGAAIFWHRLVSGRWRASAADMRARAEEGDRGTGPGVVIGAATAEKGAA